MASLDLFIVNVALPDLGRDLRRPVARRSELGPQRLRDRLRRAARALRPAGRPVRPQGRLPARARRVHPGQRRLRGQRLARVARRLPGAAGRRRGRCSPRPAWAAADRDPAGRPGARGAHLGGVRRARRGGRARRRRRAGRRVLALGVPDQRAGRPRRADLGGPRSCRPPATTQRTAGARPARRRASSRSRIGALALGLVKGPDWGWTSAAVLGAFAVAVARDGVVLAALRATRCRSSTRRCCGCAASASPTSRRSVQRRVRRRTCWPASCGCSRSGATRPCAPASASPWGR